MHKDDCLQCLHSDMPAVLLWDMGWASQTLRCSGEIPPSLRSIFDILWVSHTPQIVVLKKANTVSIKVHIHHQWLHLACYVILLDDRKIPKQIPYGRLLYSIQSQHKPRKHSKDCLKESLEHYHIDDPEWENCCD